MEENKEKNNPLENLVLKLILITTTVFFVGFLGGLAGVKFAGVSGITENIRKNIVVEEQSAVIDVVNKVQPSVVSITSEQAGFDFFGRIRKSQSSGTGFVVNKDGLIITNKHVVESDSAQYSVFTSDGKEYKGKVIARDPNYDIAFLKIDAKNLTPVELGDSNSLKVGEKVVAIGNALGQFQNTVTTGVVSAIGRAIEAGDGSGASETLENLIQTDAAINPGNSGGPLLNIDGQVIGINTAVSSQGEGIGFAIPINIAKAAITSVEEKGKITRAMLGIRYININKEFASRNNLSVSTGALLFSGTNTSAVVAGSPAARAGLKEGDIIVKINDAQIKEGISLATILTGYKPGDRVTVTYIRDGKEAKTEASLIESS